MSKNPAGPRPHGLRPYYPEPKPFVTEENEKDDAKNARFKLLWKLMDNYIPATKESVQVSFVNHIEYTIARSRFTFDCFSAYLAASYSVRDRLIELFNDTMEYFISTKAKQIYYVSIEFLLGRFLRNALLNLEIEDLYRDSLRELGVDIDNLYQEEYDPGLGNGGLGRLAACFMDSLATSNLPGWGYGLMYSFGMFKQMIGADGSQLEIPDYWLNYGDPWRVQKSTVTHTVHLYGHCEHGVWKPSLSIMAVANDFLIPGFGTDNTLALRLWSSKPTVELDEAKFRGGDYYDAISMKQRCENLTSVLYPNDNTWEGKEMRLMQEYFMSSATLQDIIRRLKNNQKASILELPNYAAIQLNDTHPAVMVAELMRILLDDEELEFNVAFDIVNKVFSYTCHTLMPEALEKWDLPLFEHLLPRHIQIIYEINQHFIDELKTKFNATDDLIRELSIIEESTPKRVRMANLAVIGSHMVNGVAEIHSDLMKKNVFNGFYALWPHKFINKTNGVTVRRWLHHCNPQLSQVITRTIGDETWALRSEKLVEIMSKIHEPSFKAEWAAIKTANKVRLAQLVEKLVGVKLRADIQLFDVHVKRIHEYKRQQLNIFSVISRYLRILEMTPEEKSRVVPRAMIYAGKAAPGYYAAKKIIKLINNVAKVVNNDPNVGDLLKVVYLPNYNVTLAETIIPATDVSQQISTAGTEASGTSNMKFAFNGGLIIGTYDGATIEIADAIGQENVFFFGAKADEVEVYRKEKTHPIPASLKRVFETIRSGLFGEPSEYDCIIHPVETHDNYLVAHDFQSYLEAQQRCDDAFVNEDEWVRMCITSTANMGRFSSDRTIAEYAEQVWGIKECRLPPQITPTDVFGPSLAPTFGPGSVGGSLRRHQTASMQPGEVVTSNPVYNKGGFGSLSNRGGETKHVPLPKQKQKQDSDDGDEIAVEFDN